MGTEQLSPRAAALLRTMLAQARARSVERRSDTRGNELLTYEMIEFGDDDQSELTRLMWLNAVTDAL